MADEADPFSEDMPEPEEPGADEPAVSGTAVAEPEPSNPAWQRVQLARHPKRPHSLDYIQLVFNDFEELHGDRFFGDDPAIVGGFAWLDGKAVMV
ncbi:MAG: acetyl-CoA carboxylase carboxyl transferase subunit alpha, partial [Bryobacteraceae bacterium]